MRFSASKQHARFDGGPNMTPLVDVVMVILIFLMLSGSFGIASHFLPANLPLIASHVPRRPIADQVTMMELYVSSPTEDTFRARLADGTTFTDVESLRDALVAKRAAHEAQGGSADRMQVMIDARRSTRYHHLIAAYEAAMAAKWPKIGFRSARD
jgi:biopolymer transport protein ExbD